MADDDQRSGYQSSPPTQWSQSPQHPYHSHHGTPAQEYPGFNFGSPHLQMEHSAFPTNIQPRPMPQQLQPLIMPQWPSMLNSQTHSTFQPIYSQPVQAIQPVPMGPLATPVSATSNRSPSNPRKTLTDLDRKRMCQYFEEHPNSKQTEIGAVFGVERSTVSKVLRQKEKYLLQQDEGSRSPVKRPKGRSPDIERALAVWAKNQEKKGLPLTDDLIREKARAFAATTTSPDNNVATSASWLEKFKLNNNLMGARSRKGSLAPEDAETMSTTTSTSHTPTGTSPTPSLPIGSPSPIEELRNAERHDSLKTDSPGSYLDFPGRQPFHAQSATSLNSAFTDTAPSSFSPGPLSPTSPFFTPDSGTAPSPFVPQTARPILPAVSTSTHSHRPRSQTFPQLDQYMSNSNSEAGTPRYTTATVLDSPMEEPPDPLSSMDGTVHGLSADDRPSTVTPADTMRPPPLPSSLANRERKRSMTPATPMSSVYGATSPEEARRALEVVLSFFEQQPSGFLDFQESVTIGKLMEKLKLQNRGS